MAAKVDDIRIDINVMRRISSRVEEQRQILHNCFASIRDDALRLRGHNWEGISADSYYDIMKTLCDEQPATDTINAGTILNTLRVYVTDLTNTAERYRTAEDKLATKVSTLRTDDVFTS